ncbi:MAG: 50S ribosomal protein L22 [Candidatus Micrarchaeota archaeon]
MSLYKFSFKVRDEKEVARAQAYDLDASYKDLANVFHALKGKTLPAAKKLLEECIAMKKPIRYVKFNKGLGHRSQLGGKKGRFPKKEARIVLTLLKSAEANANFKGLDIETLVVRQGAAYKQNVMRRYRQHFGSSITLGYGKQSIWANYETCRAEIVLAKGSEKDLMKMIKAQKKSAEKKKAPQKGKNENKGSNISNGTKANAENKGNIAVATQTLKHEEHKTAEHAGHEHGEHKH